MSHEFTRVPTVARSRQLRPITFEANIAPHATGSVLVSFGATRVICAAMIEPNVPTWMRQQGVKGGWLTAEYSMLPYSTLDRKAAGHFQGKARRPHRRDPAPHRPLAARRHRPPEARPQHPLG
jgi:ribonuclease PH